jgi:hypothetical protein
VEQAGGGQQQGRQQHQLQLLASVKQNKMLKSKIKVKLKILLSKIVLRIRDIYTRSRIEIFTS